MTCDWCPVVTVVVPMLNESGYIEECLDGFARQTYPPDNVDVVVVDGGSTDGSRQYVEKFAATAPWVRVVDNPSRKASAAFNRGVEVAKGDVVCLFSAHGVPDEGYVERSVAASASSTRLSVIPAARSSAGVMRAALRLQGRRASRRTRIESGISRKRERPFLRRSS